MLAVPTIVFGIAFYVFLGRRAGTKKGEYRITSTHADAPPMPNRLRRLVPFIILSTFAGAVTMSTIAFIPLYMVDHFGVGKEKAAVFLALIYSAGLWAGPLGGYLSDRLGRVPIILGTCLVAGPVIYLLNLVPYGLGIGIVVVTIGVSLFMRMPVAEAYLVGQTSERNRSMIFGIYFFCVMEGGGILTPVIGYLVDQFGFYPSLSIAGAALVVVTLVCSIWLWGSPD